MVLFTAAVLLGSQTDGRRRAWTTRDSHESRDVAGLVGVAGCVPAPPEVGVAGFEPTAPRSQSGCATKLRHTPWRPESRRTAARPDARPGGQGPDSLSAAGLRHRQL